MSSAEDTVVPLLPEHLRYKQGRGGKALAHRLGCGLSCGEPPDVERRLAVRRQARHP